MEERKNLIKVFDEFLRTTLAERIALIPEIHSLLISKEVQKEAGKILKGKKLDAHSLLFLEYLLRAANLIYNETALKTGLTDSEYDALLAIYTDITGKGLPVTELITANNKEDIIKPKYSLGGTLSKIYKITEEDTLKNSSQKTIEDWVKSLTRILRAVTKDDQISDQALYKEEVLVFMKFDGLSVMIEYDDHQNILRALTRGDVQNAEALNITNVVKNAKIEKPFPNIDETSFGEFCVKYEAMMCDEDLPKYNKEFKRDYKNTRSAVASIINSKEFDYERIKYLRFIPHRFTYFEEDGKESLPLVAPGAFDYPSIQCRLMDFQTIRDFAIKNKTVYRLGDQEHGFRCDGAVIRFVDYNLCELLGSQDHKPRYEVAYKFTEEYGYSKIVDVEYQVGLFGRVTPVVLFEPVKLKGNKVTNAAVSYPRFKDLSLHKGDVCKISYDIIPYLEFDSSDPKCERNPSGKLFSFPETCPYCGSTLIESENGGFIECQNKDCECRKKGKILNFLEKIGVEGISVNTVETLYQEKIVTKIQDLFKLENHRKEILALEGFGKKKFNQILESIEQHKTVYPSTLLAAVGIPDISVKKFKQILKFISYEDLMMLADINGNVALTVVPGVKEVTANKIIQGLRENAKLLEFLEQEMNILPEVREDSAKFKCVFTKIRDKELEDWIKTKGGVVQDSVTKETNFIIVPDMNVTSSKVEKAKKQGLPIVEIGNLKTYVNENFGG